jgi:hypothetical protein
MNRCGFAFACVLAIAPAAAWGGLSLQIGPKRGDGRKDADLTVVQGWAPRGQQFFDLMFDEDGPPDNEALFAYDVLIKAPPGINLVRAEKPDKWVFTAAGATFTQVEADARHILVNGIGDLRGKGEDITKGARAARVFFTVDPAVAAGRYDITLDAGTTTFGSNDPNRNLVIPVTITDPGVVIVSGPVVQRGIGNDQNPSLARPAAIASALPWLEHPSPRRQGWQTETCGTSNRAQASDAASPNAKTRRPSTS